MLGCLAQPVRAELLLDHHLSALPDTVQKSHFSSSVPAEKKSPAGLTLKELTDLALRNNPDTREAWSAVQVQMSSVEIAQADKYPNIGANVSLTRGFSSGRSDSSQTQLSSGISLSYILFDFGARSANEQAERSNLLAANLTQNRTLQAVVTRVEQAYYQLLAARQTVLAAQKTLTTVQFSLDVANQKRRSGMATIGDVYQAQTAVAQSRLQLRKAQGEAGKFKGVLCNAVGLAVNTELELAEADAPPPAREMQLGVAQYLAKAKTSRPDLAALEAQTRAARANIEAASAAGKPVLELSVNGGHTLNNFTGTNFANGSNSASIGINLNVPLFNGYRTANTINQAVARAGQMEASLSRIAQQIELEVWQAYFDLDTAVAAMESAEALMQSARQAREVTQARYQAGVGNLQELLSAQANEANARMEVIQAEMSWYAGFSRLNNAIGEFSVVAQ
jgi:outer membrane protein TolC